MKLVKTLFHFLGGVYLAIGLITISAIMVIVGTFIESSTGSHLFAAEWTYNHPLFQLILWLFFINILFAALRRWPYKWKHVPFLITHLGLLMILGGAILKNRLGLQGHLDLWEGSGNQHVLLPYTTALQIEEKTTRNAVNIPLHVTKKQTFYRPKELQELSWRVIAYCPHVRDKVETWIKGHFACILGHPPIRVQNWIPINAVRYDQIDLEKNSSIWNVGAFRTESVLELMKAAYMKDLTVKITSKLSPKNVLQIPLYELINTPVLFDQGKLNAAIGEEFDNPHLIIQWNSEHSELAETLKIPLAGEKALFNILETDSWLGTPRFIVDLTREFPAFILIENNQEDIHVCCLDRHGRMHSKKYSSGKFDHLVVYEEGFGGYTVQTPIPASSTSSNRQEKEKARANSLALQMKDAINSSTTLAPPLKFFGDACNKSQMDIATSLTEFFTSWKEGYRPLFSSLEINSTLKKVLEQLDWSQVPEADVHACQWVCLLFEKLEYSLLQGEDLLNVLKTNQWPFKIDTASQADALTKLAQQIFSVGEQLPPTNLQSHMSATKKAQLLSAYLKAYDIDYRILDSGIEKEEIEWKWLETPFTQRYLPVDLPKKLEDRRPCILLEAKSGSKTERMALAYQPTGNGLKWPLFDGRYLVQFQPQLIEIPYRLRLRQAREIHYPASQQPYSYESDLWISHENTEEMSKTLSMNQVHETWDGYRFYLAGMNKQPSGIKYVQIVVNRDPAKYFLTYPGSLLVFLGIILLFWLRPYSQPLNR